VKRIAVNGVVNHHIVQVAQAAVDDSDFLLVSIFRWRLIKGYAYNQKTRIFMHRLIMKAPAGMDVDHRNHKPLDNRRANLRICTTLENHRNTRVHKNNRLGVKGVYRSSMGTGYEARIRVSGKKLYLGMFTTIRKATIAYRRAARKHFGAYAHS
jgi:hypothetical protein